MLLGAAEFMLSMYSALTWCCSEHSLFFSCLERKRFPTGCREEPFQRHDMKSSAVWSQLLHWFIWITRDAGLCIYFLVKVIVKSLN